MTYDRTIIQAGRVGAIRPVRDPWPLALPPDVDRLARSQRRNRRAAALLALAGVAWVVSLVVVAVLR